MERIKRIINRELSWLSFNARVLQEAGDSLVPLVERMKFLGIFSNNLDEFFKVRIATIKRMIDVKMNSPKILGEKPKKLLLQIQNEVIRLQTESQRIYQDILKGLEAEHIFIVDETNLTSHQRTFVEDYFEEKVLSAISPIILDNVSAFPYLEDRTIYFGIILTRADGRKTYALMEIPTGVLPRFLELPNDGKKKCIILLDDVIRLNLKEAMALFKYEKYEAYTIKLTRDAELDIDNDLTKSFLEKISKSVGRRRKGQPVRLVYDKNIPRDFLEYIKKQLDLGNTDNLIPGGRYHNFKDFMNFPNVGDASLEFPPLPPMAHPDIRHGHSIIKLMDKKDVLLHFPYHKFSDYINLLREAAIDPEVEHIKICLYRIAKNSRVMSALINALHNGKKVTAVIELQARFDENSNIYWARQLEEAGAKVLFGIPGLKVHSKITLIIRKAQSKIRLYSVFSTGNFHDANAASYTDLALLTADQRIGREVDKLFDYLENPYIYPVFSHLLVSPQFMRRKLYSAINQEIIQAKAGEEAWMMIKINSLVDPEMVEKLYEANKAGVQIHVVVRGACSLRPGVPGLSENIHVVSIVGRYLEHSRIFIFCNGGNERYYISSADWMSRNLNNRIEVATPIYDPKLQLELKNIINCALRDNVKARIINKEQDNPYKRDESAPFNSQLELYRHYQKLAKV